jgi:hypothetical protein
MPRQIPPFVAVAALLFLYGNDATAQALIRVSTESAIASPMRVGRVDGMVRDEAGGAVAGVSIVAMGETISAARSDARGRFSLLLEPGEYVLRATRTGYISTYREAIVVRSSARVEREIRLTREGASVNEAGVVAAQPIADSRAGTHSHSEAAWRLRHLPRSILRDATASLFEDPTPSSMRRGRSLLDRAVAGSARVATALFGDSELTGQVNFLATSAFGGPSGALPETWPRSIAYFSIGSDAGLKGDWQMRGSIGSGERSAWALVGQYQSPRDGDHVWRVGISYSAHGYAAHGTDRVEAATPITRSVAGVFGYDTWTVGAVEFDYGMRLDRYDYLASPQLFSPRAGGRVRLPGRFFATASASQHMSAPGADEFLPPATPGPWVPPERTFASLRQRPFEAERTRHIEVGVGRAFGATESPSRLQIERIEQSSMNQIATMFGLDGASGVGHYYVATPGDVNLRGWAVHFETAVTRRVLAMVEYTVADAIWDRRPDAWTIRRVAPSALRREDERLHDLSAQITAEVPQTATRVSLSYRVNSAFSPDDRGRLPVADGRFDLQIRQGLPYQPFGQGRLEVLVSARTLSRDRVQDGGFYDELLTVAPPLRLMGGVQIRF